MEDPFHSLLESCHISSSQEQFLQNCPFARQSDDATGDDSRDSVELSLGNAAIVICSLQESADDETTTHDVFQTPPEEVQPTSSDEQKIAAVDHENDVCCDDDNEDVVAVDGGCTDGVAMVEQGKKSDLGFSGAISVVKVVSVSHVDGVGSSEISECGLEKFRVSPRQSKESLGEPPAKKPKISEKNSGLGSSKESFETLVVENIKSPGNLTIKSASPSNCNSISPKNIEGNDIMLVEDSLVKRKLDFPNAAKVVEPDVEGSDGLPGVGQDNMEMDSSVDGTKGEGVEDGARNIYVCEGEKLQSNAREGICRNIMEDLEKFKYIMGRVRNTSPLLSEVQGLRALPLSICRPAEDASMDLHTQDQRQFTPLDVLKMLCEECDWNTEETDILEIAKKRGMTFPRPRWWPPSDSDDGYSP